jgi:hypothetical protein
MIRTEGQAWHLLTFSVLILALLLTCFACRSKPESKAEAVPQWLESIPTDKDHYYAVGISGPTPRVTDAWDQAIRRARAELGRLIISHVRTEDTIIGTSSGDYVNEIVKILSDAELNYTEVVERWADRYGVYGPSEHYYVLVRMEKRRAELVLRRVK